MILEIVGRDGTKGEEEVVEKKRIVVNEYPASFEKIAESEGFRLIAVWDDGDGSLYIYENEGEYYDYWTYWYGLVPFQILRVEQVDENGEVQNTFDLFVER